MKRILIGCNGGITGVYLAKNLKDLDDSILLGADADEITCGRFFVDKQLLLPKASDDGFVEALIDIINTYQIEYYLPTHSIETRVVSYNEEYIRERISAKFIISPSDTYKALEQKDVCNDNLRCIGLPVPERITSTNCNYPIFMKRCWGSGSIGTGIIDNARTHRAFMNRDDCCFFEYIEGDEYTCDCLFDGEGTLVAAASRRRIKTIGGAVSITESSDTDTVIRYIEKLADNWKLCGCVNFQYIVRDDVPYFTDVNLRYPSGGLPLTVAFGIDIPKLLIRILDGESIGRIETPVKKKRMYRFYEELFEDI